MRDVRSNEADAALALLEEAKNIQIRPNEITYSMNEMKQNEMKRNTKQSKTNRNEMTCGFDLLPGRFFLTGSDKKACHAMCTLRTWPGQRKERATPCAQSAHGRDAKKIGDYHLTRRNKKAYYCWRRIAQYPGISGCRIPGSDDLGRLLDDVAPQQ